MANTTDGLAMFRDFLEPLETSDGEFKTAAMGELDRITKICEAEAPDDFDCDALICKLERIRDKYGLQAASGDAALESLADLKAN